MSVEGRVASGFNSRTRRFTRAKAQMYAKFGEFFLQEGMEITETIFPKKLRNAMKPPSTRRYRGKRCLFAGKFISDI